MGRGGERGLGFIELSTLKIHLSCDETPIRKIASQRYAARQNVTINPNENENSNGLLLLPSLFFLPQMYA